MREGDVKGFEAAFNLQTDAFPTKRRVSNTMHRQYEYLAVSLVNSFMIAAIQDSAYPPEANWVADRALLRISRMDDDLGVIPDICHDAAFELCALVRQSKLDDSGNFYIEQAKRYLVTHLTQVFRRRTGMTPRQYRDAKKWHGVVL